MKNQAPIYLIICMLAALICSCGRARSDSWHIPETADTLYVPSEAEGFKIMSDSATGIKALTIANPWQGAADVEQTLYIFPTGTPVPQGVNGLSGPAKKIVAMSSTYVAMLNDLDGLNALAGVSGINYITNPYVSAHRQRIVDVGNEADANFEAIVNLAPDLVIIYGVSGQSAMQNKLDELKIPYIYFGDYLEQNPLGKAEWIVAMGVVTEHTEKAKELYQNTRNRYNTLKDSIAQYNHDRPTVLLNAPYGDAWFIPGKSNYMARLIADAGACMLAPNDSDKPDNSSRPIEAEQAYLMALNADYWLNPGSFNTLRELTEAMPRFGNAPSVGHNRVFNNTLRSTAGGGNDFYESGAIHPDIVLRDLISIFHPDSESATPLVYYHRLK